MPRETFARLGLSAGLSGGERQVFHALETAAFEDAAHHAFDRIDLEGAPQAPRPYGACIKALCFDRFGGADVLAWRDVADPELKPGHALVRMKAVGLNFADVYRRKGNYHLQGRPPYIAGYEGAGVVEAVDGASYPIKAGDMVGFADVPFANAELVSAPLDRLIPLSKEIDCATAAAVLLQGLTAQYLTRDSHPLKPGEGMLVHAAAGGVGLLLTQIGKLKGARVLGVVSSPAKAEIVKSFGADAAALNEQDWVEAARRLSSSGEGLDVAYDSVGSTLPRSFEAVRKGGRVVFYGMAGGDPAPVDPRMLMDTSKTLTGGDLWNVLRTRQDRVERAAELFSWLASGKLKVKVAATFPLADGAQAHAFLESRGSVGKVLLIP